jgi:nicotinamidase-related amidase
LSNAYNLSMPLPLPLFYDSESVGSLFLERAAAVAAESQRFRESHHIRAAADDVERIAALGIDCQVAFCHPAASLFVPGAVEDTQRTIEWLYRNLARITTLFFTLDTHSVFQIFHPTSWVDPDGEHPQPLTVITARDVREGRWRPALTDPELPDARAAALEYCERLEQSGRYVLTIWPYHALLGGLGHALVPALMEASLFHAVARQVDPVFEIKGRARFTENYSALSPEVRSLQGREVGVFNAKLFDALMAHDRIYVFGQAKSHCVLETLRDLERECRRADSRLLEKIFILEDATSPVPAPPLDPLPEGLDFPRVAATAFVAFREAGMHLVRTSDPLGA